MRSPRALLVFSLAFLAGCGGGEPAAGPASAGDMARPAADAAPAAQGAPAREPEATSLLGKPLIPIEPADREKLEANLAAARDEERKEPNLPEPLIWVGRRQAYLWQYRDAIETFTHGIARFPSDPRFLRHRGHRYITVREFDKAIADLDKATQLLKGKPDEIEPDGAPNAAGIPRSTLHFNVWYRLGLAYYLKGDYTSAARAYEQCMRVSPNDDLVTATADWQWMTLMRLGNKSAATQVLERITEKMDILENQSYHRRLLMYKGLEKPEALLDTTNADDITIATQGYGVGNYYFVTGDAAKAKGIFEKVIAGRQWAAFGYIAAEADLARMK